MRTRSRAAMLASACSCVFFAIGAAAPIWTVPGIYTPEEVRAGKTRLFYVRGPVWHRPEKLVERSPFSQRNLIHAAVVASIVMGVWLLVYRAAIPRDRSGNIGDFEEKGGGSIADGRAPTGDPPRTG